MRLNGLGNDSLADGRTELLVTSHRVKITFDEARKAPSGSSRPVGHDLQDRESRMVSQARNQMSKLGTKAMDGLMVWGCERGDRFMDLAMLLQCFLFGQLMASSKRFLFDVKAGPWLDPADWRGIMALMFRVECSRREGAPHWRDG